MNLSIPDVLAALTPVVEALEQLDVRHHIGGSVASSAYGVPRSTADVDLIAELAFEQIDALVTRLQGTYYVERQSVRDAVLRRRAFNVIHLETMIKVDIFVPEARPFDQEELRRARPQTLAIGVNARPFFVKSPEDLVLRKLVWYRAGGEVSERQWGDVIGVLKVQEARLDHEYLDRWAAELGLEDLLQRALVQAKGVEP